MSNEPSWMQQEETRSSTQTQEGTTANTHAPRLERVEREPMRKQKAFYIQPSFAHAFEDLALKQKRVGGKKATQLAEEMILDLLEKYGEDTSKL